MSIANKTDRDSKQRWYFETSAANYLQSQMEGGATATRNLQLSKGRDWRLSPTTLWEILLTNSEEHRELLIDFCQHLFSPKLMPSPSELIVQYIEEGVPKVQSRSGLDSNTSIARAWTECVEDKNRTLILDPDALRVKANALKTFSKQLHSVVKDEGRLLDSELQHANVDMTLIALTREAVRDRDDMWKSESSIQFLKLSLFFALLILCTEADFDSEPVARFWNSKGCDHMEARIEYLIYRIPEVLWRGPFVLMAHMTLCQTNQKYSRGLWFDCMHCAYLSYADAFFTNDHHFTALKTRLVDSPLAEKVTHMSEVEWIQVRQNWLGLHRR